MEKKVRVVCMLNPVLLTSFEDKLENVGVSASKFLEGCAQAYIDGDFKFTDARPTWYAPLNTNDTVCTEEPSPSVRARREKSDASYRPEKNPVGRPKHSSNSFDSVLDKTKKLLLYKHPVQNPFYNPAPTLLMSSADKDGVTFEEFFRSHWLGFRIETDAASPDWFDFGLPMFMDALTCKFIDTNQLNLCYRKDDIWGDVVNLNDELVALHMDEMIKNIEAVRNET